MGLRENMTSEKVSELSLREAIVADPATTVRDAVARMCGKRLGCVIVAGEDGRPIGTFTEEVLIRILVDVPRALDAKIGDHMSAQWACVKLTDPIANVLEAMESKRLRFICVVDDAGRATGLTGQRGLMEYIAEHFPRQVMVQRVGVKSSTERREGA
jgi:predicted transcriptional regulator